MEMIAEPLPRIGANKLFPIRTRWLVAGLYEMNANLWGIMWSVAPVSATRILVEGLNLGTANAIECAGGLVRRAMTCFGSLII
jgi:hypothetical protein